MKIWITLATAFLLVTGYVFYSEYLNKLDDNGEGDAPIHALPEYMLGGIVEEPNNDTLSIGNIQTQYVKYTKGNITFDEMLSETEKLLVNVLNYPFSAYKGYLFSAGYDYHSATQVYYQSNQEETRTVIYRVEHKEGGNIVTKIYDGKYLKLVSVGEDSTKLHIYDNNNEEEIIGVR